MTKIVAIFEMISDLQELWIEFGTWKTKKSYAIHKLFQKTWSWKS